MKQIELLNRRFIGAELRDFSQLFAQIFIVDEYLESSRQLNIIDQKIVLYQLRGVIFVGREVVGYDTQITGHPLLTQKDFAPCLAERRESVLSSLGQLNSFFDQSHGDLRVVIDLDQQIIVDLFL